MKLGMNKATLLCLAAMLLAVLACNIPALSIGSPESAPTAPATAQAATIAPPPTTQAVPPSQPEVSTMSGAASSDTCMLTIYPGKSTRADVVAIMNEPNGVDQQGSLETMRYPSEMKGQENTFLLENQVVVNVVIIDSEDQLKAWSEMKSLYGEPAHTAYSNYLPGSLTFAYPEKGLAFIADETMDVVFIRQCFVPMTLEDYLAKYGMFLPAENPFTR